MMATRDEILSLLIEQQKEILDRLDRMEAASTLDPWDQDFDLDGGTGPQAEHPDPVLDVPGIIEKPEDWDEMNEEQRAAWARIVADGGQPGPIDTLVEVETQTVEIAGGHAAQFPAPSDQAKAKWAETAHAVCENYKPSPDSGASATPAEAEKYYRIAGPLWLAAYDHGFLMGLPPEMRAVMVQTVNWYAPIEAQLLSRDILRADTESAQGYALERIHDEKAKKQRG